MGLTTNQQSVQTALGGAVTNTQTAITTLQSAAATCTSVGAVKTGADLTACANAITEAFAVVQADLAEINDIALVS